MLRAMIARIMLLLILRRAAWLRGVDGAAAARFAAHAAATIFAAMPCATLMLHTSVTPHMLLILRCWRLRHFRRRMLLRSPADADVTAVAALMPDAPLRHTMLPLRRRRLSPLSFFRRLRRFFFFLPCHAIDADTLRCLCHVAAMPFFH